MIAFTGVFATNIFITASVIWNEWYLLLRTGLFFSLALDRTSLVPQHNYYNGLQLDEGKSKILGWNRTDIKIQRKLRKSEPVEQNVAVLMKVMLQENNFSVDFKNRYQMWKARLCAMLKIYICYLLYQALSS